MSTAVSSAGTDKEVVLLESDSEHGSDENIFGSGALQHGTRAHIVSALRAHRHEHLLVLVGLHAQALTQALRFCMSFCKPRISKLTS